HATAALVTSGTATLETALFDVPQVVCYETPVPHLIRFGFKHIIKVKFISLVNLIANKEIVPEMLADRFTVDGIANELYQILPGEPGRDKMLAEYQEVRTQLGDKVAPDEAAGIMFDLLVKRREMLLRMARAEEEALAAQKRAEKEAELARIRAEKARLAAEAKAREAQQRVVQAQYEAQETQKGERFEEEQEKGEMF
ncbi:lipid-A-disaccharide synthase, partial [Prevotella copri]|nr:lipid-A-disaccharide synthase [Segatella copri]